MTRTQIATADFSCGGMQKGTNGDESDERLRTENSYIDNRHKYTHYSNFVSQERQ